MRDLFTPKLSFDNSPTGWPPQLKGQAWIGVLITPVYLLGGLLAAPGGFEVLAGQAGWRSLFGFAGILVLCAVPLGGLILLARDKAVGMALLVISMAYLGPMLGSLFLSIVALGSWLAIAATLALAVWSLHGVRQVHMGVDPARLRQVKEARIVKSDEHVHIAAAGGTDQGESVKQALKGLRAPWSTVVEFLAALLILLLWGFLVPSSIAFDGAQGTPLVWGLWFVLVAAFLAGRGMVNGWLLLLRAAGE